MLRKPQAILLYLLVLTSFGSGAIAFAQSGGDSIAPKACPFEIVGIWRSDATTVSTPFYFEFSPEGYVTILSHTPDALPHDFEMTTSVNYKLDRPKSPTRIDFAAVRGNDIFGRGVTSLKILEFADNSFTTLDTGTEQKTQWVRERTRRYFLTLAARSGTLQQGGPAFAMWTTLEGREPRIEALGVRLAKDADAKSFPVFGAIPAEVYDQVTEAIQKDKKTKEEILIVRFELTQAEFETTHKTYQEWDENAKNGKLSEADAYSTGIEFFRKTLEGLNKCGDKIKLHRPTQRELDEIASKHALPQRLLEYIRTLRSKNDELNVPDAVFPWFWRPTLRIPE
jgi:hypothetical protein